MDGRRLAMVVADGPDEDIWAYDLQKQTSSRLTHDGGGKNNPVWVGNHDGYVLFGTPSGISWVHADAASKHPEALTTSQQRQSPFSFTPKRNRLAFMQGTPGLESDLWTVAVREEGGALRGDQAEPFLKSPFNERAPAFSPDGRWLAYQSNESGRDQVYVEAFPKSRGKQMISIDGGQVPLWSRAKRELFFRTENGDRIMVSEYTAKDGAFVAESPHVWCQRTLANPRTGRNFDIAPDGKHIVAIFPAEAQEPTPRNHIVYVENFFDELRRRVPVVK
jgi:Tol biopolymer transport system component